MLSSLVKEHSQRQAVRREHQETLRQNANKASADLTQALVDHLVIIYLITYIFTRGTNLTEFSKSSLNQNYHFYRNFRM